MSYVKAFLATAIISIIPNLLLIFIPSSILKPTSTLGPYTINVQNVFLAFASGGLLGDVFLHVLPHLIAEHSHSDDDHHNHDTHESNHNHDTHESNHNHGDPMVSYIGTFVVFGYLLFFLTERLSSAHMSVKEKTDHNHNQNHSDDDSLRKTKEVSEKKELSMYQKISTSGWLNLSADSMHNFTDGLAIGASFATNNGSSHIIALSTFLSVLFHEIPHEIGDFSILLDSGLSKYEAIKAQYITAVAAFAGTLVGLFFQRNESVEDLLLSITSGGFIYIASTTMIPKTITIQTKFKAANYL